MNGPIKGFGQATGGGRSGRKIFWAARGVATSFQKLMAPSIQTKCLRAKDEPKRHQWNAVPSKECLVERAQRRTVGFAQPNIHQLPDLTAIYSL